MTRFERRRGARSAALLAVGMLLGGLWLAVSSVSADEAGPTGTYPPDLVPAGAALFVQDFTVDQGLGPLFNETSCVGCHLWPTVGGMGRDGLAVVTRVGRLAEGRFDPLLGQGGPVARTRGESAPGAPCSLAPGIPPGANVTSVRNTPPLFGLGQIDQVPDEAILALAVPLGDGVHGRANLVDGTDGRQRVGRFGWKGDTAALEQLVADALRNEHGITSPLAPTDLSRLADGCSAPVGAPEDDGGAVAALTAFLTSLPAPTAVPNPEGERLFAATGCAACHTPSLPTAIGEVRLYSDLLLHDVGPALDDGVPQGMATGRDWRTTPLMGLGLRQRFLHDGRARTIEAAIRTHAGEADAAVRRYQDLPAEERALLHAFLGSL